MARDAGEGEENEDVSNTGGDPEAKENVFVCGESEGDGNSDRE